jgi:hypothetical protein
MRSEARTELGTGKNGGWSSPRGGGGDASSESKDADGKIWWRGVQTAPQSYGEGSNALHSNKGLWMRERERDINRMGNTAATDGIKRAPW